MKKVIILIVIFMSGYVVKGQTSSNINLHQKKQTKRIVQGIKTGELTKKESKQLIKQQKNIQHQKTIAKSDGVLSKKERARIKSNQLGASANIYRKKHNYHAR